VVNQNTNLALDIDEEDETSPQPTVYYKFNFRAMEDEINEVYTEIRVAEIANKSNEYNVGLSKIYRLLADMMFAVLTVNPPEYFVKHGVDFYEESCSYALIILNRIKTKRINWDHNIRHAWTWYIRVTSRYFHYGYPKHHSIEVSLDQVMEEWDAMMSSHFIENEEELVPYISYQDRDPLIHRKVCEKLFLILQIYYDKEEIFRMMPLILYSIQFDTELPQDAARLRGLFIVTLKRLMSVYNESESMLPMNVSQSVNRNTITLILLMFLSSEDNQTIPLEIISSLDFFSMVRLSVFAGGKTIYIPTVDEIESVVTSAIALSTMLTEGTDSKSARKSAKQFIGYKHDIRRLNRFIKSMVDNLTSSDNAVMKYLGTDCESTFYHDLLKNLNHVTKCQTNIITGLNEKIKDSSPEALLRYLGDLDDSERKIVTFIERLIKLKKETAIV
jgi:hypothetical protein